MTEQYEIKCWSCGSLDMEDKGTYVKCRACGATWNSVPSLGSDPLADHGSYLRDKEGTILLRRRHPSKSLVRAAGKARAQKYISPSDSPSKKIREKRRIE